MGRTYGRINYWMWNSGFLHKVVMSPAIIFRKGIVYCMFHFKEKPGNGIFCIQREALSRTKKAALKMDISNREYNYMREDEIHNI